MMESFTTLLDSYSFLGNELRLWLVATSAILVAVGIIVLVRRILKKRFAAARETETTVDDALFEIAERTNILLISLVVLHVALRMLELPPKLTVAVKTVAVVAFFLQVGLWLSGLVEFWIARYRRSRGVPDIATSATLDIATLGAKLSIWTVVALVTLDNLGINITALVAGLGIGGVAVALAVQNILGDLFASLSIIIDKPFVPGDFIVVGDKAGRVQAIGLKTTRIAALGGEQIVFSNGELLKTQIRNFRHLNERRVLFAFGVVYQTPREVLERIPSIIKAAVEKRELTRFDRAHFRGFGESSLDFEAVYFVLSSEYNVYMDIQQAINLELVSEFEQQGIEFAYPTRTLLLEDPRPSPG